jgi:hypothetical protein
MAARQSEGGFEQNPEMAAEGMRKTALPRGEMNSEQEEHLAHEDMEAGNQDIEGGDLGQAPGMPRPGSGREHPHGAR